MNRYTLEIEEKPRFLWPWVAIVRKDGYYQDLTIAMTRKGAIRAGKRMARRMDSLRSEIIVL